MYSNEPHGAPVSAATATVADAEYRYAAFISYRHIEPDAGWARWLHRAIEEYGVPRDLVEQGAAARIRPVFRDKEELAASHSLSESIEKALEQARFLIVVCSPRTPGSRWVNEEVLRFRQLGRSDRILALLIEGEPENSFPPALRTAADAAAREPLAADVRARAGESRRRARVDARLRLIAPLLGCGFDELRQREHERQRVRLVRFAALLAGLLLLVSGLALAIWVQWGRAERGERRTRAQTLAMQSQVEALANERALEIDNHELAPAALLALESLALDATPQGDEALRRAVAALARRSHPLRFSNGDQVAAIAPKGAFLLSASETVLRLWRPGDTVPVAQRPTLEGEAGYTDRGVWPQPVFSPDGLLLATVAPDSVRLRRVPSLEPYAALARPQTVDGLHFAPGSRLLLLGPRLVAWNYADGTTRPAGPPLGEYVTQALSGDGRWLAVAEAGRPVRILDLSGATAPATVGDTAGAAVVALSRDGARVAFSDDAMVEVWDRARRRRIAVLPHEWLLAGLWFSPDGHHLATTTHGIGTTFTDPAANRLFGSTLRVWDIKTRREVTRIPFAGEEMIHWSAVSADGDWLVSATWWSASVRIWNLWPDGLRREACSRLRRNLSPSEAELYLQRNEPPLTCPGLPIPAEDGGYDDGESAVDWG
jgi:hypothetical protein